METLDAATASLLIENPALNTEGYSIEELEAAANGTPLPAPEAVDTPPVSATDADINNLIQENPALAVPLVAEAPAASNKQEIAIDQNSDITAQSLYNTPTDQNPFNLRSQFSKFNAKTAAFFGELVADWSGNENSRLLPIAERSRDNEAAIEKRQADYLTMANNIFKSVGFEETDDNGEKTGRRIFTRVIQEKDDAGNLTGKLLSEDFVVPKPNEMGPDQLNRILRTGVTDLVEAGAGLTRGDISDDTSQYPLGMSEEDRNLNQRVPNQELSSGEQLLSDLTSLAIPATVAIKGTRLGLNLLKRAATFNRTAKVGSFGNFTSTVVGASLAETLMADDAQTGGFFMDPKTIKTWFGEQGLDLINDRDAKDIALMLDGLLINGAMDGLLTVTSKVIYPFFSRKTASVAALADIKLFKKKVQNGQVLEVVKFLDPEAFVSNDTTGKIAARNLKKLSEVLNNNSLVNIKIGDFESQIPASTTQALYTGAEAYIRETRQYKMSSLSKEAWEEYVEKESDLMFSKMVALMRSNQSVAGAEAGEVLMLNSLGNAIKDAGAEKAGEAGFESSTKISQNTANNLITQWDAEIKKLTGEVTDAEDLVSTAKLNVDEVVQTDPEYIDLEFIFTSKNISERMRKAQIAFTNSKLYPEFKAQKTAMDAAFDAIPNDPIGPEAGMALIEIVQRVATANTNLSLKEQTGVVKNQIRRLFNEIQPRALGEDLDGTTIFESDDFGEIAERIGKIGFKDLFNLRASLNDTIMNAPPEIKPFYIALKRHISSGAIKDGVPQGQLAFIKQNGNPATADAAERADELYQNFDNRWKKPAVLAGINDSFNTRLRNESLVESRIGDQSRTIDSELNVTNFTEQAIRDQSGGMARTLSNTIEEAVTKTGITDVTVSGEINSEVSSMFLDVIIYDVMKRVIPQVGLGKTTAAEFNALLQPTLEKLRITGNTRMAQKLEETIASVRERGEAFGNDLFDGQEILDTARKNLAAAENNILETLVTKIPRRTVDGVPDAMVVVGNPKEKLAQILLNNDDNAIKSLLDEIDRMTLFDGSPNKVKQKIARIALQSVAMDTVGTRIFGSSIGAVKGGRAQKRIKLGEVDRLSDSEATGLFRSLDLIFPEGSGDQATEDIREGLFQTLSTLYDASLATNVRGVTVGSDTFSKMTQARQTYDAVSTGILLVAGYMNPTAAMLRRLAAEPLEGLKSIEYEAAQAAMATIISDPRGFAVLVDQLRGAQNISIVQKAVKSFVNQAYLTGKYEFRIREEEDTEAQYKTLAKSILGSDLYEGALPTWLTGVE